MTEAVDWVSRNIQQKAEQHKALSHPVRLAIYELVTLNECRVGDVAYAFPLSRWAVQKHIAILAEAGFVIRRRQGRYCWISSNPNVRMD